MADIVLKKDTASSVIINPGAPVSANARLAADFNNLTGKDIKATLNLQVQYDDGPPVNGNDVLQIWHIIDDGLGNFAEGGDGVVGNDVDPQGALTLAVLQSISPSLTTDEFLQSPVFELGPGLNRFVVKNISGQTFDATMQIVVNPWKYESV